MRKPVCLTLAVLAMLMGRSPAIADGPITDGARIHSIRLALMESESLPAASTGQTEAERPPAAGLARALRGTAWGGVGITLALVGVGTAFGVLAQQRANSLTSLTVQRVGWLPPIYDSDQQSEYTDLQSQGQTYEKAAVACFVSSGATALASASLFWFATRNEMPDQQLALAASITPGGATFSWAGRF